MAEQMKNLSEEILANYKQRAAEFQQRLKDNAELVKEVQKTLDGFRNDHAEMAANLRSNLAQEQKDRLKSFHQLMSGIHGSISEIQSEVEGIKVSTSGMLKDFSVSHDAMATNLNNELAQDKANRANWNTGRMKEFGSLMKNINTEIVKIQKEVSDVFGYTDKLLKKFSKDHDKMSAEMRADLSANLTERVKYTKDLLDQYNKRLAEMSKALKADLAKSRKVLSQSDIQRMKDFNVTFTGIQKNVHEIQKFVNTFLGEFSTDRKQAAATWAKLAEAIANLGKTPTPAPKKAAPVAEKPVAPVVKKEVVAEEKVIVAEPVVEKPKPVEVPKELTLEEKVLQYINNHKKGVKVADMEEPFGETRMRLGFITKKLLDDGKILKVENAYFPKPK